MTKTRHENIIEALIIVAIDRGYSGGPGEIEGIGEREWSRIKSGQLSADDIMFRLGFSSSDALLQAAEKIIATDAGAKKTAQATSDLEEALYKRLANSINILIKENNYGIAPLPAGLALSGDAGEVNKKTLRYLTLAVVPGGVQDLKREVTDKMIDELHPIMLVIREAERILTSYSNLQAIRDAAAPKGPELGQ